MSSHRPSDTSPRPDFEPPVSAIVPSDTGGTSGTVTGRAVQPRSTRRWGRPVAALCIAVVVLIAVVAAVVGHRRGGSLTDSHARSTPPPLVHPLPTPGPRPDDPLLQQVWGRGDDVYPMDLSGLTFSFRAPGAWGCLRSAQAGVRWICVDQTGLFGGRRPAEPSGGIIESDECSAPCGPKAYADVLRRLSALGIDTSGLHIADARTRVSDTADPAHPGGRLYRMSRVYDSDGDGSLDRHLWVRMKVSADDEVVVQKMLGDLFDATR